MSVPNKGVVPAPPLSEIDRLRARVTELEGQIATLRFNAAATPKLQPIPQRHGWDVE